MKITKVLLTFVFITSSLYAQLIYEIRDVIVERYTPGGSQAKVILKLFIKNLGNETAINTLDSEFRSILSYPKGASNDVYNYWDQIADFSFSYVTKSSVSGNRVTNYPTRIYITTKYDEMIPIEERQFRMPYSGEDYGIEWLIVYTSVYTNIDYIRMKILGDEYIIGEFKNISKQNFIGGKNEKR